MISISVDVIFRCHKISTRIKLPVCPPPTHEHFVKMTCDVNFCEEKVQFYELVVKVTLFILHPLLPSESAVGMRINNRYSSALV